ncbi:hypothetical protein P7G51_10435 [Enterococcus asini]|uniref:hypothetical protein n=1 Tax=Enterococcus asini TaxID=57732 RepID=UPI0028905B4E|nr:hypothetical protein [Enterococcus asini]MDT2757798.1 hypothetical protein [Enterococcus asini]
MTKLVPAILSNLYLVRRSVKKANHWGVRHLLAIFIVVSIFLECVFFKHYLKELVVKIIAQETQTNSFNEVQNLQLNQAWYMPFSLAQNVFSVLILLVGIYLLFDYRNKFSLMKTIQKADNQTKLYLGVDARYVIREMLLKNFFIYLEGFVLSLLISFMLNKKLLLQLNALLPYQLSQNGQGNVLWAMAFSLLILLGFLLIFSLLLELIHVQKVKKSGTI